MLTKMSDGARIAAQRATFEANRAKKQQAHVVEYFHQFDDSYSHLTAQILAEFASRYHVQIKPYLMRSTGGKDQPEELKLAIWARRDEALIAPHFDLELPENAPRVPSASLSPTTKSLAGANPLSTAFIYSPSCPVNFQIHTYAEHSIQVFDKARLLWRPFSVKQLNRGLKGEYLYVYPFLEFLQPLPLQPFSEQESLLI